MPVVEVVMREPGPTRAQRGIEVWSHIVVKSPNGIVRVWEGGTEAEVVEVDEERALRRLPRREVCSQYVVGLWKRQAVLEIDVVTMLSFKVTGSE